MQNTCEIEGCYGQDPQCGFRIEKDNADGTKSHFTDSGFGIAEVIKTRGQVYPKPDDGLELTREEYLAPAFSRNRSWLRDEIRRVVDEEIRRANLEAFKEESRSALGIERRNRYDTVTGKWVVCDFDIDYNEFTVQREVYPGDELSNPPEEWKHDTVGTRRVLGGIVWELVSHVYPFIQKKQKRWLALERVSDLRGGGMEWPQTPGSTED